MTKPTFPVRPDILDRAAGLDPTAHVYALRAQRPEFIAGAEACRAAILTPEEPLGLSEELRLAVMRRVALGSTNAQLIEEYTVPEATELALLAAGEIPKDAQLAAIAHHADMIASNPALAGEADLIALQAAGLTVSQIIALSELLAFACYQIRVVHGLALLERHK